jgi:predicted  nucleic acid-binding Zn-ribbon protein
MAGEQSEAFPPELREWVERKASERGTEPETILARAAATYRYLDEGADGEVDLDDLDARVAALEDDLDAKIQDVRERVIQVKRETDAKASADHDHPNLEERLETVERTAEEAATETDGLAERVDRGFENYEEVLEYLTDTTDDLDAKTTTLAGAVVDLRRELQRIATAEHDRQAVDDLRTEANRHGDRTASCADCGSTVDLGLLSRPACPHCEATLVEFDPARGFFGSATLVTGDRPALTGDTETEVPADPADLFEDPETDE